MGKAIFFTRIMKIMLNWNNYYAPLIIVINIVTIRIFYSKQAHILDNFWPNILNSLTAHRRCMQ